MSNRLLLLGSDEVSVPTTAGTGVSFTQATCVRLYNANAADRVITVQESRGGTGVGTFTLKAGTAEILEKKPAFTVFASGADVKGVKVGFTN
tara:strand:- start:1056 stop:1331 length:276 start_codon:yes stop_codon:yes gene_type:complete